MKKIMVLLILASVSAWAQQKEIDTEKTAISSSKYWLDIDYVGDNIIGHKLDIHLPKNGKAPYPVVIAIYGSAWFSNSAKEETFKVGLGQKLLENGFAVVNVNHRSSSDAIFPAQIYDIKAAIRFIRANSREFALDDSFIGVTGWSSGGHLTALTGTTNSTKTDKIGGLAIDIEGSVGKHTDQSSHINAAVDWFGPTDFLIMDKCGSSFSHNEAKSPESSLIGGAIQENAAKVALANPISYVNKNNPPFLIFHGDKDPLVPDCQSKKLYEKLQKERVQSELVIIAGGGHGPGVMIDKYYSQMTAFFEQEMKKTKK
ncbi:prolyl oligopeptidase family serine peptidase [Emticicia soli]|uniref:Prolyl oligopeptidase family serine peptidase n=1 Tax=Emticicia soli TaxID=2027878 RepID=A0ABW5JCH0_9BACT